MDYTKLGHTGLDVSRICLGCMGFGDAERWTHKWVLDEENSRPIIKHALDLGINFFDTANIYSLGRSELTQDEVAYLEAPYVPHRVVGAL